MEREIITPTEEMLADQESYRRAVQRELDRLRVEFRLLIEGPYIELLDPVNQLRGRIAHVHELLPILRSIESGATVAQVNSALAPYSPEL